MADLDVAVIIVTYKSAQLTIDCLQSVERELLAPGLRIRCVIVDNASGDSPAIAQAISARGWGRWARLVTADRNGGFAYGNNLGVRAVYESGPPDYLHLLNPDTVLRPGAIEALVRFLQANPGVGVAGGIFENADASEWAIAFRFPSAMGEVVQGLQWGLATRLFARWSVPMQMGSQPQPVDWVSGASMMVRRTVLDAIGGLDEGFRPLHAPSHTALILVLESSLSAHSVPASYFPQRFDDALRGVGEVAACRTSAARATAALGEALPPT